MSRLVRSSSRPLLECIRSLSTVSSTRMLSFRHAGKKGPQEPIIMYTCGMDNFDAKNSQLHTGFGIFIEDSHPLNLELPLTKIIVGSVPPHRAPELQAIILALYRLRKWAEFKSVPVVVRTRYEPILREIAHFHAGDFVGSRNLMGVWRQMERFRSVRVEGAEEDDPSYEQAMVWADMALETASGTLLTPGGEEG